MRRENWICKSPKCGKMLIVTSPKYLTCPEGDGRLIPRHGIEDFHVAVRYDYKRFRIRDEIGIWEYVPNAHKGCMDHAPEEGHVVAKVRQGLKDWRPMTFRKCKPPRTKT